MTPRLRLTLAAVILVLWAILAGVARAQLPTREEQLERRVDRLRTTLDSYMQTDVLRCEEGDLVRDVTASVTAGESVYSYSGSGCRIMALPEPSVGLGLALCVLGLVTLAEIGSDRSDEGGGARESVTSRTSLKSL